MPLVYNFFSYIKSLWNNRKIDNSSKPKVQIKKAKKPKSRKS